MSATPDLIIQAFATGGNRTAPPQTDPNGFVNYTNGYTPDYEISLTSGNTEAKPVERQVQNYLFYLLTGCAQNWQQQSICPWYSTMSINGINGYPAGAIVAVAQTSGAVWFYRSLVDDNVVNPSTLGQTSWEYVPLNMERLSQVAMPAGGSVEIQPGGQTTELIQAAAGFNTLTLGTYEYISDAIANSSSNAPVQPGATTTYAGMLEAKQWVNSTTSTTYNIQRYTDRTGNVFYRGATNGTWTPWRSVNAAPITGTDQSVTANTVTGNIALATGSPFDGQIFTVVIANTNTGASTFSPNGSVAQAPIVGLDGNALTGNEMVATKRASFQYAAAITSWILLWGVQGEVPVAPATKYNHAMTASQVQQGLAWYAVDSGTANAYKVALAPIQQARPDGMVIKFRAANANTGSSTLQDAISTSQIVGAAHVALQGGEIVANSDCWVQWNAGLNGGAGYWILIDSTGGAMQASQALQSQHVVIASQLYGFRNKIINGHMNVDQRNLTASVTPAAASVYSLDRWKVSSTTTGKFRFQQSGQSASVTPLTPASALSIVCVVAYAPVATDSIIVEQIIENSNLQDLYWGSSYAQPVSLQFKIWSPVAGTHCVSLTNFNYGGSLRCIPLQFTVPVAGTWTQIYIPNIPGDITGNWNLNGASMTSQAGGMELRFGLCVGSDFIGPSAANGVWSANNYSQLNGNVNWAATLGNQGYITDVQLEKGSVCTPMEVASIADELARCQRYYEKVWGWEPGGFMGNGAITSTNSCWGTMPFKTPKVTVDFATGNATSASAAGTWLITSAGTGNAATVSAISTNGHHGSVIYWNATLGVTNGVTGQAMFLYPNNSQTPTNPSWMAIDVDF